MATETEKLLLQIDAQTTLLRQELAKARGEIDGFANTTERRLNGIDGAFARITGGAGGMIRSLGGIAAGFIGISQAAALAVNSTREMQRLSAQLEVATGSATAAKDAFDGLAKFAEETPFTLTQVTEAYIRLKNLGIEPTEARLRSFGNTSAAMGKDLMQFIEAVADASTGEFERLKEFGIRASKEGDKVRFTFQGVTTSVKNNSDAIANYLQGIGESKFGDAMAKQADTIDGKLSNLEDATGRLGRALGGLGIGDATMSGISLMTQMINDAADATEGLGRGLSRLARDAANLFDRAAGVDAPRDRGPSADTIAKGRERDLATINALPQGSAIRTLKESEFRKRYGIAEGMALQEDAMIEVVASRKVDKPKASRADRATTKKPRELTIGERARRGDFDVPVESWAIPGGRGELGNGFNVDAMLADLEKVNTQIDLINVKPIQPISPETLEMTRQFADNLTSGLAQAIVYGQDIGKALVSSIKAAAAQLIASKLLDFLGGIGGKIFGGGSPNIFKRESGGPVKAGQPYLVGEKRPEIFVPNSAGYIMPRVPKGSGGGKDGVVHVSLDQGLVATMVQGAVQVADARGADRLRKLQRRSMTASPGA